VLVTDAPEPKPCTRFAKRFVMNARLLAHLPECDARCLANGSNKLMRQRRELGQAARNRPN
jgi:hypothetical protein